MSLDTSQMVGPPRPLGPGHPDRHGDRGSRRGCGGRRARCGRGRGAQGGDGQPEQLRRGRAWSSSSTATRASFGRASCRSCLSTTRGARGPSRPAAVADMIATIARLQRDPCRCLHRSRAQRGFPDGHRLDRRRRWSTASAAASRARSAVVDWCGPRPTASCARVGDTRSRYAETGKGAQFVFFSAAADSVTGRSYAYGFAIPAAHMVERVFRPAFQSLRVIPRHLLSDGVGRTTSSFRSSCRRAAAAMLFSTAPAYPDGPSNALNLPTLRGGLIVRAHLNPQIKDALIPGGIPRPIPVRELGLIGLSLALLAHDRDAGASGGRARAASLRSGVERDPRAANAIDPDSPRRRDRPARPGADGAGGARSLASIMDETKRLQQLIDNVLHFSRAERQLIGGRQLAPVELRPVASRAADDLGALVAGRGIVLLDVDIADDLVVQRGRERLAADRAQSAGQRRPLRRRSADRSRSGAAAARRTGRVVGGGPGPGHSGRRPEAECGMRSCGWTGIETRR